MAQLAIWDCLCRVPINLGVKKRNDSASEGGAVFVFNALEPSGFNQSGIKKLINQRSNREVEPIFATARISDLLKKNLAKKSQVTTAV